MVKDSPKKPSTFMRPRSRCVPPWRPDPGEEDAITNPKVRIQGFYLVRRGHQAGVYTSCESAEPQIWNYEQRSYRRYETYEEALKSWQETCASGTLNAHDCVDDDIEVVDAPSTPPPSTPPPSSSKTSSNYASTSSVPSSSSSKTSSNYASASSAPSSSSSKTSSTYASASSSAPRPSPSTSPGPSRAPDSTTSRQYFGVFSEGRDFIQVVGTATEAEDVFNSEMRHGRRSRIFIASSLKAINVAAASVIFDRD
ncbi:hypothetical protein BDZ89DRAFT_1044250 [Hymenopellis radicata]|nr:hypothetical protein BDZ89DRAFT_1044250 [Hymenopellis radicata]